MKLYTVNSWYDVDLLCNDDVDYIDSSKLLVDYESYKLLKARNVELEAERDAMREEIAELRDGNEYVLVRELREQLREARDKGSDV